MSLPAQRQVKGNQNKLVSQSAPQIKKVAEFAKTRIKLKREMNPIVKVENDIILENTVELTKHLVFCKIKEYENQMNAIKAKIEFEFINKLNSDNFLKKSVEKEIVVTVDTEALQKCQEDLAAAKAAVEALKKSVEAKEKTHKEALDEKEIEKQIQTEEYKKQIKDCQDKIKKLQSSTIEEEDESESEEEDESAKEPTNANLYFTLA